MTIGGQPYSTLKEFIDNASISEAPYTKEVASEEMVKTVLSDFETVVKDLDKGIELAGEAGDDVTEDYVSAIKPHLKSICGCCAFI